MSTLMKGNGIVLFTSACALLLGVCGNALAYGQRTFVSVNGSDANVASSCAQSAPCRLWDTAISQTIAGGEVVAADSGGFGSININKSITISAAPGVYASIAPGSSAPTAINITSAPSDRVVIRNLHLDGNSAGSSGVGVWLSGGSSLVLINTAISRFTKGVLVTAGSADLHGVTLTNNSIGIEAQGQGPDQDLSCNNTPRVSVVRVNRSTVVDNNTAFHMHNPGTNVGGGTPTACGTGGNPGGARAPGSSNAQNIFLIIETNTTIPNSFIAGNTRFVDVTGTAEYNGVSSPDGTIGYVLPQTQNGSTPANQ